MSKTKRKAQAQGFWLDLGPPADKWADTSQTLASDDGRTILASQATRVNTVTQQTLIGFTQPITKRPSCI